MTRKLRVLFAGAMLTALCSSTFAAPDPAAIMKKAGLAVNNAKTYQGKWRMVISMGDMGTMSMDMDVKTTSDGKAYIATTPVGTPTGMMAMGAAMAATTTVSDGKTLYTYIKAMNAYQKMPAPKNRANNPALGNMLGPASAKDAKFKYLGTEMVRGKKCHVIRVEPPARQSNPQQRGEMTAYVDVATGRLAQMRMVMTMPGMGTQTNGRPQSGSGGNGTPPPPKPITMTTTMVVLSETLNAPIPASTFKFTPPKGATEMKNGMVGGMGGVPGAGAPRGPVPPAPRR